MPTIPRARRLARRPSPPALLLALSLAAAGCGDDGEGVPTADGGVDGGRDGGPDCGARALCDGACVDTARDPAHCGGCGVACGDGAVCNAGACAPACGVGTIACGGACVDPRATADACGGCGVACGGDALCAGGACGDACPGGTTPCAGACVDPATDARHCGACDRPCGPGAACADGACFPRPTADMDGDGVSDEDEGAARGLDTDGDGSPDYADADSDGDGVPDADEAGDDDPATPPVDADGDGAADLRDRDADNDGLEDGDEVALGTDPRRPDSDGDGDTDAMEALAGSDPTDAGSTLATVGWARFEGAAFGGDPVVGDVVVALGAAPVDAVVLLTTSGPVPEGSADAVYGWVRADDAAEAVEAAAPDTWFATGVARDFPIAPYGGPFDRALQLYAPTTNPTEGSLVAFPAPWGGTGDPPTAALTAVRDVFGAVALRTGARHLVLLATPAPFHRRWDDATPGDDPTTWCGATREAACPAYAAEDFEGLPLDPATLADAFDAIAPPHRFVAGLALDDAPADQVTDARHVLSALAVRSGASVPCEGGDTWDPDGDGPAPAAPRCPLVRGGLLDGGEGETPVADAAAALVAAVREAPYATVRLAALDDPATAGIDEDALGLAVSTSVGTPADGCPAAPVAIEDARDDGVTDAWAGACPESRLGWVAAVRNTTVPAACEDRVLRLSFAATADGSLPVGQAEGVVRVPGDPAACTPEPL